jgi:hypothetical protein
MSFTQIGKNVEESPVGVDTHDFLFLSAGLNFISQQHFFINLPAIFQTLFYHAKSK